MAYNTAKMITDASGKLIPQLYDPATDTYKPLTPDAYNNINVNSGALSVDNFPTEQAVRGNVQVDNFPATQQVEGNVRLKGSNVELIRDLSMTVTNAGVHSVGDTFSRGLSVPSLDVSGYKDITILIESLSGATIDGAVLRMFFTTGNVLQGTSPHQDATTEIELPSVAQGEKLFLTGDKDLNIAGFLYIPELSLPIKEIGIASIIQSVDDSARVQFAGRVW